MATTDASGGLVLLLHGRGGVSTDLAWLEDFIPPPWRPVTLRAPLPLGAGFEWFRVPEDATLGPASSTVAPAADGVIAWIDQHAPATAVGLVGYSQGGAVALHAVRRRPGRFDFVATFAGFTTVDAEPRDAELARLRPPVLWSRGSRDDVIPRGDIDRMQEFLPAHSALEERVYSSAGHEITVEMAHDLTRFIANSRPARPAP